MQPRRNQEALGQNQGVDFQNAKIKCRHVLLLERAHGVRLLGQVHRGQVVAPGDPLLRDLSWHERFVFPLLLLIFARTC